MPKQTLSVVDMKTQIAVGIFISWFTSELFSFFCTHVSTISMFLYFLCQLKCFSDTQLKQGVTELSPGVSDQTDDAVSTSSDDEEEAPLPGGTMF